MDATILYAPSANLESLKTNNMSKLTQIQTQLKAKKSQYNSFGKYHYRKCEDILEALKPLLAEHDCTLTISDSVYSEGGFTFVNATVRFSEDGESWTSCEAQAGIEKAGGMALPQAFGSASSYARKYALGAMFLLDDTEDADATNTHEKKPTKPSMTTEEAVAKIEAATTLDELRKTFTGLPAALRKDEKVVAAKDQA